MKTTTKFDQQWMFEKPNEKSEMITIPHTWNSKDGQDGGDDYWRGECTYSTSFEQISHEEGERVYLEFLGVNASATVMLNEKQIVHHNGGYSTFRVDITDHQESNNKLVVKVSNEKNREVYPQRADFTFYGGIYRDINVVIVPEEHFDLDYYGSEGIKVTAVPMNKNGVITIETFHNTNEHNISISILDHNGEVVKESTGMSKDKFVIHDVHLWNGIEDPYLYTAVAEIKKDGQVIDRVQTRFGVRSVRFDAKQGFYLNGKKYTLRGVSRHQDRKDIGNAISIEDQRQDMKLICEMGANAIRLAHYQHDQFFYNLCDEIGMIVLTEIPYISEHMPEGNENSLHEMKELIVQNYNHPCIAAWGISNEITIKDKHTKDMMIQHERLNDLCHAMDPNRKTFLSVYAACPMTRKIVHKGADITGYNLYLGWYVPGLWLNDLFMKAFHLFYPKRCLGYTEYGAEGMPNLHSSHPKRGDNTEEYQSIYHEYMLKCFERHPFMWGTFVWNMFDFAADARDQGGEPGMNHKGLVTFDRQIKKDSFYLYKAFWSDEKFVHICGRRYVNRAEKNTTVKIYSNQPEVELILNGVSLGKKTGNRIFTYQIKLEKDVNSVVVKSGEYEDAITINKVDHFDGSYKLKKTDSKNWT